MFHLVLVTIWLIGAWLRVYRQAQFYQIEEYMGLRYLRWCMADRTRVIPSRPLLAWLLGLILSIMLTEEAAIQRPYIVLGIAAIVAVIPPSTKEIKKSLVLTNRVKRLLICSGLVALAAMSAAQSLLVSLPPSNHVFTFTASASIGFACFLLAPLWLVLGNTLIQPLEALIRRRYLNEAAVLLRQINPTVIGITGSYGKTTTKFFLRDILSVRYQTYATPKSYNTLMGISLAINRDLKGDYRTEYFISEMGAYVEGEIERICHLTPPDIAIVTEIGPQHLERFGSLENIQNAKYELIRNLPPDGAAVFNWDNPYIRNMADQGYPATRLMVSREVSAEKAKAHGLTWVASDIETSLAGISFSAIHIETGEIKRITADIVGEHNVTNLLLCIALARHEGIPLSDIALRIRSLRPAESRLVPETTAAGITIINDAYSANPAGVVSALTLLGMYETGRRLLITPGMIELGELHESENGKLGLLAAEYATDIILIGQSQTAPILRAIQSTSFDQARLQVVDTLQEAVSWYQRNLQAGDAVLFLNDLPDTY
ncbi:MAG: UDP-N-acetylmuramoyl-tripeptide--D-alanyl-D-alanine ligase [Chloroflexi bacterium]|nr:UDP-N-acetylmuramoyl-tripeptide--D-alanyl-D-alanine ligase [Chloroflexota bacterium]